MIGVISAVKFVKSELKWNKWIEEHKVYAYHKEIDEILNAGEFKSCNYF